MQAQDIFVDRNALRGDLWRKFPPSDKIRELRERVMRVERLATIDWQVQEGREAAIADECLDIINYAVFLIRQTREGVAG